MAKNNKFLEGNYFIEGDIKTLAQQRKNFDEALVAPKPVPRDPPQTSQAPSQPKPQSNKKEILSTQMLKDLIEKRDIYLRSVFREEDDIYNVQSRFVEYEHQIRKLRNNMDNIFSIQPPKDKLNEHEQSIMLIYNELEIWESFEKYNKNKGFSDFKNLENTNISEVREDIGSIIKAKIPGKIGELQNQEVLKNRGKSVLGEENIPQSFLQDKSFMRKKEQIRTLRSQNQPVISKKQESPEDQPEIHINEAEVSENSIKENKEDMNQIGENSGEQVSQINVEEDSEIEYDLKNISGKSSSEITKDPQNEIQSENTPKKISTIHEMDKEYQDGSMNRFKRNSYNEVHENRFATAYSKNSQIESSQFRERKNSLIKKKRELQDELKGLRAKLENKREQSINRSRMGLSRRSVSRLDGSGKKGFKNVKKSKNSKMLVDEIKR